MWGGGGGVDEYMLDRSEEVRYLKLLKCNPPDIRQKKKKNPTGNSCSNREPSSQDQITALFSLLLQTRKKKTS